MYMTDITFLFIFLPAMLIATALQPKWKNYALLFLSIFFYACGSPVYFVLFLVGTIVNVILAYAVQVLRTRSHVLARSILVLGVGLNVGCLFYYDVGVKRISKSVDLSDNSTLKISHNHILRSMDIRDSFRKAVIHFTPLIPDSGHSAPDSSDK